MAVDKKIRNAFLIAAGILLAIALVWGISIAGNDELSQIASMLNSFGGSFMAEDIYVYGDSKGSSIAELCDADELSQMTEASAAAGFSCDTQTSGDIAVLLAAIDDDTVATLYILNGKSELCFVQKLESGEIFPIHTYFIDGETEE